MKFILLLLLSLPYSANAQIISQVEGDLDGDGMPDTAFLIDTTEGMVDLTIEATKAGTAHAKNIAWIGAMAGTIPSLELTSHGSLRLLSGNESIGRGRWNQVLPIAYRENAFRVAGFTYGWYDTLNLEEQGLCDLNLLSGKGEIERGPDRVMITVTTTRRAAPISEWEDIFPEECKQQ